MPGLLSGIRPVFLGTWTLMGTVWHSQRHLGHLDHSFGSTLGALADTIGRKRLIVIAALCMVIEMLALLIAPMHGGCHFFLFALNRIISGVAEAAVSGADEALAYDSERSGS